MCSKPLAFLTPLLIAPHDYLLVSKFKSSLHLFLKKIWPAWKWEHIWQENAIDTFLATIWHLAFFHRSIIRWNGFLRMSNSFFFFNSSWLSQNDSENVKCRTPVTPFHFSLLQSARRNSQTDKFSVKTILS